MKRPGKTALTFAVGLLVGLAVYHGMLFLTGRVIVSDQQLAMQDAELEVLRQENHELTDELFRPKRPGEIKFSEGELPYDASADAGAVVSAARTVAVADGKFLMVTFGANWCLDCRTLHHHLSSEPVTSYVDDYFLFVNVDVGKFNRNRDIAESLGVSLTRGIPVAVFFSPDGELIGTTNEGQLEPARHYSSAQILKFVRDVVERRRIQAPYSVD